MLDSLLARANPDGVIIIDSGNPGPTIGIIAITHGNEIAGLIAFDRLLGDFQIEKNLQKGRLFLILNNLEASRKDIPFNDADMNRIWEGEGIGYEYVRREVIKPYLSQCDHILDLHSTTAPSVPMTVSCRIHSLARRVLSDMLVTYQIENIGEFVIGKTLIEFHNDIKPDGVAFAVECGSHRSPTAGDIAYENTLRFLSYFGLISYVFTQEHVPTVLSAIRVYKAPDIGPIEYLYTDQPESFQKIPPHTQVARFQGEDIFSPDEETYILMPTPYARYIGDSVMYFTREILE